MFRSQFLAALAGAHKCGKRLLRLDGPEFVRRFLLHVLPSGMKRIRHCGVLASSCKEVKLPAAPLAGPRTGVARDMACGKASSAHYHRGKLARLSIQGKVLREIRATKPHKS